MMNHEPTYQIPPDDHPSVRPSVGRIVRVSLLALFTSGLLLVDVGSMLQLRNSMELHGIADAVSRVFNDNTQRIALGVVALSGLCIWTLVLDGRTLRQAPSRWITIAYTSVGIGIMICGFLFLIAITSV